MELDDEENNEHKETEKNEDKEKDKNEDWRKKFGPDDDYNWKWRLEMQELSSYPFGDPNAGRWL